MSLAVTVRTEGDVEEVQRQPLQQQPLQPLPQQAAKGLLGNRTAYAPW
jgi:hypothetical protein